MFAAMSRLAALLFVLGVSGCVQRVYEVRMTPRADGSGWDRSLRVTEHRTRKDEDGRPVPEQKSRTTSAIFDCVIASDVGNAGSITRYPTTLGTLTVYMERFRGQARASEGLTARMAAADESARIIGGWLKSEGANWPRATRLPEWCDRELATDLRDLSVYAWLTGVDRGGTNDAAHSAGWLRVMQMLTERGYLEPGDLSMLSRLMMGGVETDESHAWVTRMVARKAGDVAAAPGGEPPAFLSSWEAMSRSLAEYLRPSAEYAALLAQYENREQRAEGDEPPHPTAVLGEHLGIMFAGMVPVFTHESGLWSETLDLQLAAPVEPGATNGRWRAGGKVVRGVTMMDGPEEPSMFPFHAFAQWAEPDEAAQRRAMNGVVMRGAMLARYCLWRNGLTADEGRDWDAAMDSLRPGVDPTTHFAQALGWSGHRQSLLENGIGLVNEALEREKASK